jgi:outer membrane protein
MSTIMPVRAAPYCLSALLACAATTASAQSQSASADQGPSTWVNRQGWPELPPARHYYLRLGYTYVKPNDKAGPVIDRSGPVIRYGDEATPGLNNGTQAGSDAVDSLFYLSFNIRQDHPQDYATQGLGSPLGATIKAGGGGNWTLTAGAYLDDDYKWAIDAYIAGIPIETKVRGAGRIGSTGGDSVNLGDVLTTRQLGPIVIGRRVLGDKGDRFRPFIGVGMAYIVFLEAQPSEALQHYVGGPTHVKLKNAFGIGPFVGGELALDERWSLNATLGYLKMKTSARIVTQVDPALMGRSLAAAQAAKDVGPSTLTAVQLTNGTLTGGPSAIDGPNNVLPEVLQELARARTGNPGNLGSYTREIRTTLDSWLLTMSVGYAF